MKITCVIPTCDRPEFLNEALASVFAQSRKPDEIIIVNNGKTAVDEPRAKVFNIMPYAGVAQARNFGAALAASEVIAFLDDDDLWATDYLERVSGAFEKGADCVVSRLDQSVGGKTGTYKNAAGKLTPGHILVYNPGITGSNTAVLKEAFFAAHGYDPKLPPSEDKGLVLEMLLLNRRVVAMPESQAIMRQHAGGRLTDSARIAEGIYQFVRKYRSRMSFRQRLMNWLKIYRYRSDAGQMRAFLPFAALYIVSRFIKLMS